AHLPTARIDHPSSAVRGGASILRGGEAAGPGILSKDPSRMRLTPKGRLAPEAIRKVVNQHAREIERCYNASVARERGLEGRLEVEWIVDRIGTVSNTRIIYDEVGSDALKRCLRTSVKRWVFPPPRGGPARVSCPFIFSDLRR
ncbi:MAG: TonB family protein, partial [Deltaproteobacteria bacterium]|nr:TonB family protein [Deltaproteobacteria bacterium]